MTTDSRAASRPSSANFSTLARESLAKYENCSMAASLAAENCSTLNMAPVSCRFGWQLDCCTAQMPFYAISPLRQGGLSIILLRRTMPAGPPPNACPERVFLPPLAGRGQLPGLADHLVDLAGVHLLGGDHLAGVFLQHHRAPLHRRHELL